MKLYELKNRNPEAYEKYLNSLDPKEHKYIKSRSAELLQKRFPDLEDKEAISHAARWIMSLPRTTTKKLKQPFKYRDGNLRGGIVQNESLLDLVKEKIEDMSMGDTIKDFYKSDAPQFKGKSKKKRRQMAIAAKLSADESVTENDSREEALKLLKVLHTKYVKSGKYNAFELPVLLRQHMPELSKQEVRQYAGEFFDTYKAESVNENMIGEPDRYYDAEERKQAYNDLQDALSTSSRWQEDMIKDGICPECSGTSYMDGDEENGEDSCYGWSRYGCDQGEMEGATWKEIIEFDKRQAQRRQYPGDEEVARQYARIPNADIHTISQQLQADYPHLSPSGRARIQTMIQKLKSQEGK